MGLIQCKECKKQVSEEAEKCPHCGAPGEKYKIFKEKKWYKKTSVTLFVASILIVIGIGFVHIITGSNLDLPFHIVLKDSFGYSETFVNIDKITGMPCMAAKSKYPIGCKVLGNNGYIESDEQFDRRVKREFEEDMKKTQSEFMEEYNEAMEPYEKATKARERLQDALKAIPEGVDSWYQCNSTVENNPSKKKQTLELQGKVTKLLAERFVVINECLKEYPELNYILEDWVDRNPNYFVVAGAIVSDYNADKNRERDADAYLTHGNAYKAKDELDQAISDYTKAIEINPRDPNAYSIRGDTYCMQKKYDQAISDCEKAIEIDPRFAEAYFTRGNAFCMQKEYDQGILDLNKALEISPRFAKAYRSRGIAYANKGRNDEAISDFTNALQINPWDAGAYLVRGIAYKTKGEFDRAISDYTKAIEINPKDAVVYCHRGAAHTAKGEIDQAISDYTKAVEINPRFAEAYYNRGYDYYKKGEFDKAWEDVHKAQSFGLHDFPEFLKDLQEASGRES